MKYRIEFEDDEIKDCTDCQYMLGTKDYGIYCYILGGDVKSEDGKRPDNCPLIEVIE